MPVGRTFYLYKQALEQSIAKFLKEDVLTQSAALAFYMIYIWFGALLTAALLGAGKYLIGFAVGSSDAADLYDAAGSVLVLMLWVYYASAIFLFGATFTFERARLVSQVSPDK